MSIFPLLPNSGRCRFPELFALAQILFLGIGCATVAGFEDFKANGTGGFGNSPGGAATNGGASFIVSTGGGNNVATGGTPVFPGTGGTVFRSTGGLPGTGGATGCGQVTQLCCNGTTCGAGLECYANSCRTCGSDRQSCCNNGAALPCTGAGCCITGAVCVSTSSTTFQSQCSITCGAATQQCCTGGAFIGTGCAEGTALICRNGICSN